MIFCEQSIGKAKKFIEFQNDDFCVLCLARGGCGKSATNWSRCRGPYPPDPTDSEWCGKSATNWPLVKSSVSTGEITVKDPFQESKIMIFRTYLLSQSGDFL